jgi:hypothetical protein
MHLLNGANGLWMLRYLYGFFSDTENKMIWWMYQNRALKPQMCVRRAVFLQHAVVRLRYATKFTLLTKQSWRFGSQIGIARWKEVWEVECLACWKDGLEKVYTYSSFTSWHWTSTVFILGTECLEVASLSPCPVSLSILVKAISVIIISIYIS